MSADDFTVGKNECAAALSSLMDSEEMRKLKLKKGIHRSSPVFLKYPSEADLEVSLENKNLSDLNSFVLVPLLPPGSLCILAVGKPPAFRWQTIRRLGYLHDKHLPGWRYQQGVSL